MSPYKVGTILVYTGPVENVKFYIELLEGPPFKYGLTNSVKILYHSNNDYYMKNSIESGFNFNSFKIATKQEIK